MSTEIVSPQMQDLVKYSVTKAALAELRTECMALRVLGPDDEEGYARCRDKLKSVVKLRTGGDAERKALNKEALAFQRFVNSEWDAIAAEIEPIETHLRTNCAIVDNEKKRREEEAARAAKERIDNRILKLQSLHATFRFDEIAALSDEAFEDLVDREQTRFNAEQRKREEEAARLAELERERAANEALLAAEREKTRQLEAEAQKMREEKAAIEREKIRKAAEEERVAKAKQEAADAALEAERRAAMARAEAEEFERLKAKKAAEAKAAKEVADKKLFSAIRSRFQTLESAWVELARLYKLTGTMPQADGMANGGVRAAIKEGTDGTYEEV